MTKSAQDIIANELTGAVQSFHMNEIGDTNMIQPGLLEEKPIFKHRVGQGIIDLVSSHFRCMARRKVDKQVLCLVSHHNCVHEFMRVFDRKETVPKKMVYNWTAAAVVEIDSQVIDNIEQVAKELDKNDRDVLNLIWGNCQVTDFSIIYDN